MTVKIARDYPPVTGAKTGPQQRALPESEQLPLASNAVAPSLFSDCHDLQSFRTLLRSAEPLARMSLERRGLPVGLVRDLATRLGIRQRDLQQAVPATELRKSKAGARITGSPSYAVLHIVDLINTVEDMVRRDPIPSPAPFDAEAWVGTWIVTPVPALSGQRPIEMIDTPTGREAVMRLLTADREGVYL